MTIETLKNQLGRKFRGTSLDDIQGIENFSVFEEAASNLLSEIDPYETVRLHRFDQFGGVTAYAAPADLKGKKVIDPRPQDGRRNRDFNQTFTKEFDRDKEFNYGMVSVEFEDGNKVLRLSESGKGSARVDTVNATTGWSAAGGASGLELDRILRLDNSDTLRFDLGAAGGYIEKSTLSEVDLSDHEDRSSFFRLVYLPAVSQLTSITLLVGSASTAYWQMTGTPHFGSYKIGVNLVRFDWYGATEVLAPDSAAVDYERLTFVTTSALADVRVGPLESKLPTPFETPYYSNRIFRSTAGSWLEAPTDEDDSIVLEKEAENLFFYECCRLVAEDIGSDDEARKFEKKLFGEPGKTAGLYGQYREDKPTEKLRPQARYIDLSSRRDRRGMRRR